MLLSTSQLAEMMNEPEAKGGLGCSIGLVAGGAETLEPVYNLL